MKRNLKTALGALAFFCVLGAFVCSSAYVYAQDAAVEVQKQLCDDKVVGEALDASSGSFSVAARVKLDAPGNEKGNGDNLGMICSCATGWTDGFRLYYNWNNKTVSFQIGKEGGANGCSANAAPGIMHDIVAVCDNDAKRLTLYVDGVAAAGCPHVSALDFKNAPLVVGFAGFGVGSNNMYVDKVEYWNSVVTQSDVDLRNVERSTEELSQVIVMNALAAHGENSVDLDNAEIYQKSLNLNLPQSALDAMKESILAKQLISAKYDDAAEALFEYAENYVKAAENVKDGAAPSNASLSKYGEVCSKLRALEKLPRYSKRVNELSLKIKTAYPKETAVFAKIEKLEQSADRARKIEKDALSVYKRVTNQLRSAMKKRVVYVSAQGNDQTGNGSKAAPYASLARAFDDVAQNAALKKWTTIELAPGAYRVNRTAELTNVENVYVKAAKGSNVVLTGGRAINKFAALSDAAQNSDVVKNAQSRFSEDVRDKIFVADLAEAGVQNFGSLASRGYGGGDKVPCVPSLYLGGESQTLAQWPNVGETKLKFGEKVANEGSDSTSTFKYDFDRPDRWQDLNDVWAFGLYEYEWAANLRKVVSIDREKKQVEFDYARGSGRFDYYFVNVLEELDAPGEYFVDAKSGKLYFYPPKDITTAEKLNRSNVEYDEFSDLFVKLTNVKNCLIEGISFKLGRESFGLFTNCDRCYVDDCCVEQMGGNVLTIKGGTYCGMLDSRMRELGSCGLRISAGNRDALIPCYHLMHNNFVSDFSRIDRVYAPAVHFDGCGVAITNNLFCDSPHHAMRTDGNDVYVARNEVHSCVYEYSDQSGIDIFCDPSYRGIVIEKNLWRHIGSAFALCGQAGIRLDDTISGVVMLDNVFYRSSGGFFGGIQIHGGKDNLARGNLMVDCKQAFSFSPWGEDRYAKFVKERFPAHVGNAAYIEAYPFFDEIYDHLNRNYILDNTAVNCAKFNSNGDGLNVFSGNRSFTAKPNLLDLGVADENADYSELFYTNTSAMRAWLEELGKKSLKDVGLKGKWNGANVDVSPFFRGIEN